MVPQNSQGATLGIVGRGAESQAFTLWMPVAPGPQMFQTKMSPDIANCPLGEGGKFTPAPPRENNSSNIKEK